MGGVDRLIKNPPKTEPVAPIKGIDVSHYQPVIDWKKVKESGVEFVFIKASEYVKDDRFDAHWAQSKAAGLLRGAYHFFHPNQDPVAQAQLMATSIGKLEKDDLPCVLDLEVSDGQSPDTIEENAQIFLSEIATLTGKSPIVYGSPYFLESLTLDVSFANHPLWIAHYGVDFPRIPPPWGYWSFWQTADTGKVPGINGNADTDLFNGTLEQLMKIAHGG